MNITQVTADSNNNSCNIKKQSYVKPENLYTIYADLVRFASTSTPDFS